MDRRDEELLAKQLRTVSPPRNDGVVVLTVIMVFFAGIAFGTALTPHKAAPPVVTASNEAAAGAALPNGALR